VEATIALRRSLERLVQLDGAAGASGCAMNKNVATDILEILTAQHREVDELIAKLEKKQGDRRASFQLLADKLAAHSKVEETIFYPAVISKQTSEQLHEAVEEHLEVKRVLADMLTMKLDDEQFDAKLSVLKENVSHHAHEEEEGKLFPKLRKALSADERAALGGEVLAKFEELMPMHPSRMVPGETKAAAPLPR